MSNDADRLDNIIDEALRDLTAGGPRDGFRGRVMARIAATPEPSPVRIIELFGRRVRPWQAVTVGAAVAVLAAVALVTPGLWPARELAPASKGRGAHGAAPTAAGGSLSGTGLQTPQVVTQVANEGSQTSAVIIARRRPDATAAVEVGDTRETSSPIRPVIIAPLAAPDEITIAPIDVKPLAIADITIQDIQITPIEGGRAKQ
ncbi:MAG: hypothetical protein IMZ55_05805 [Acidobacteria bacterium]|nr:hypothetical protein [Acidobacteriota bacterium]